MTEKLDLGEELDKAAAELLKAANKDGVKLADRVDIFKQVSAHYVNTRKGKRPLSPGDSGTGDTPTMDDLRNSISQGGKQKPEEEDDEA